MSWPEATSTRVDSRRPCGMWLGWHTWSFGVQLSGAPDGARRFIPMAQARGLHAARADKVGKRCSRALPAIRVPHMRYGNGLGPRIHSYTVNHSMKTHFRKRKSRLRVGRAEKETWSPGLNLRFCVWMWMSLRCM